MACSPSVAMPSGICARRCKKTRMAILPAYRFNIVNGSLKSSTKVKHQFLYELGASMGYNYPGDLLRPVNRSIENSSFIIDPNEYFKFVSYSVRTMV